MSYYFIFLWHSPWIAWRGIFVCNILFFCLSVFLICPCYYYVISYAGCFHFWGQNWKYRSQSRSHSYWLWECSTCINAWQISSYSEKKGLFGGQSITAITPKLLIDMAAQVSEESLVMISILLSSWKSSQGLSVDAMGPQPTYWKFLESWFWTKMFTMGSNSSFPKWCWGAIALP